MVFRYLAQRSELPNTCIGEQYVDRSGLILYDCEEPVEISKVRDVALNTARIVPDLGHRELCGKFGDGVNQAADLISATASIPSLNFTP